MASKLISTCFGYGSAVLVHMTPFPIGLTDIDVLIGATVIPSISFLLTVLACPAGSLIIPITDGSMAHGRMGYTECDETPAVSRDTSQSTTKQRCKSSDQISIL